MKLLLYCTKAKPSLMKYETIDGYYTDTDPVLDKRALLNGKIVVECDFEVEEIETYYNNQIYEGCRVHTINTYNISKLLELSCLNQKQLDDYLQGENGYAIHIKNLHIFDEPKKLKDYSRKLPNGDFQVLGNAPRNMMYAYDVKSFNNFEKKVLISIHPEWMCKILNGEKTIEVRKKVLKEMIN